MHLPHNEDNMWGVMWGRKVAAQLLKLSQAVVWGNVPRKKKTSVCVMIQALGKYGDARMRGGGDNEVTLKENRIRGLLSSCIDALHKDNKKLNKQL